MPESNTPPPGHVPASGDATSSASSDSLITQLRRAFDAVDMLVTNIRPDQWSMPTPCTDWTVRRLVDHLVGMNLVFTALLKDQPPPQRRELSSNAENRDSDRDGDRDGDPVGAFRTSAAALLAAFAAPGVLDRVYRGPLGSATGADRLQIRLYDLLAHGWDLAHATGKPVDLPDDLAEPSLSFARTQLSEEARPGRFAPAQPANEHAPAIDRLAAFLGRPVPPVP
ncbi:MAG: TIGR03086 family protein [Actinobacteria bacterium]|jgi:uncharacterized protein (TIGR03086 family)|nr:TIGR03086 family protein [Actinomycetota bacterium]